MQYFLNDDFIFIKDESKYRIVNRTNNKEIYKINKRGYDLLKNINDNNYIENKKLDSTFKMNNEFLQFCINNNILKEDYYRNSGNLFHECNPYGLNRIFLEVTPTCNLKCLHCYNESELNVDTSNIMNTKEIIDLITYASQNGIYSFDITGGEPFLRKDIFEILEHISNSGLMCNIFTNLTLLNDKDLDRLRELKILKIITSIDAYLEDTHDNFRGAKGAYKKTILNIKKIKQIGIPISVNVMVTDHNVNEIKELIDYLKFDLKVEYLLDIPFESGRYLPDYNDNKLKNFSKIKGYSHRILLTEESFNHDKVYDYELFQQFHCGIGEKFAYINSNGYVSLCPSLNYKVNPKFKLGDIRENSVLNIWNEYRNKNKTLDCKYKRECNASKYCSGGCRSRALSQTGDINEKDQVFCNMNNVL